jgi:hypothetical protein
MSRNDKERGHRHTNADAKRGTSSPFAHYYYSPSFLRVPRSTPRLAPTFCVEGFGCIEDMCFDLVLPASAFLSTATLVLLTAMRTVRVEVQEEEEEVPGWLVVVVEEEGKSFVLSLVRGEAPP